MFALALPFLRSLLGGLVGLLAKLPAWVSLVAVLACCGWSNAQKFSREKFQHEREKAEAVEAAHENERLLNQTNTKISDDLYTAQAQRDAAARDAARRLRDLADKYAASNAALAACHRYNGPAVAVNPNTTREHLIDLARDTDEIAARLRGCHAYVHALSAGNVR